MITPVPGSIPDVPVESAAPPERDLPPTPWAWRAALVAGVAALGLSVNALHASLGAHAPRVQAAAGIVCFLGVAAAASRSLQSVRLRTLLWGIGLQIGLALVVTQPAWLDGLPEWLRMTWVRSLLAVAGGGIKNLVAASDEGAKFVFGKLAEPDQSPLGFVFAFRALPPIIFVSSFFSVLYYLGILQILVRLTARVMMYLMGTSGAETLSVAANVFMGQTEAPLIVKPFVPRMTRSELLALMGSGMAHISGGMMAVYISYGADPVAVLCTCVMACPCSLYLTKLVLPEAGTPETAGTAPIHAETPYVNVIDAAAGGVKDGLWLALNVAAMLIGFLAFLALFDMALGAIKPGLIWARVPAESIDWWPDDLKFQTILGRVFSPAAFLIGVDPAEADKVGTLLGIKLAANEHVAYVTLTKNPDFTGLSERSRLLAVFALTGFANFGSVGIQLGGIGAIAETRRADLARLGMRALFVGFLATLINAAVAGMLM
ncbi:NupC/NupG family nucleoside CNT transporter [Fimbriiglobus ruber]|uniref:Nucleoside permease NupC n=1 Tax=Fimbriiglobus ruber TaxID=1908690 RepID=A0A225DA56_9BACT|nr:nucleoside transporter C-terminal domain-containing protein [Fimbriiglobus ruber]OWK36544.1 Nucleoside permease NupC [Fimbriiglobus ruber]